MNRRELFTGAAAAAIGMVGLQTFRAASVGAQQAVVSFAGWPDALNYARTYKFISAEFFRQGNAAALVTGTSGDYLQQIGGVDLAHHAILTQALQALPAPPEASPAVSFGSAFDSSEAYLNAAYELKRLGLRALIAISYDPQLVSDVSNDLAANIAGVIGVEARMVSLLGLLAERPVVDGIFPRDFTIPLPRDEAAQAFGPYVTGAEAMAGQAAITH